MILGVKNLNQNALVELIKKHTDFYWLVAWIIPW